MLDIATVLKELAEDGLRMAVLGSQVKLRSDLGRRPLNLNHFILLPNLAESVFEVCTWPLVLYKY